MNIKYPPLVEQAYQFAKNKGLNVTKDEVYRMQVKQGMLTQTGEPTKKAIKQGLITAFNQKHKTLKEFKSEYPIFKSYEEDHFTQQDGVWYASRIVLEKITRKLADEKYSYDEELQVEAYFNFRNYDNPYRSIAETKGVFHPLYTPYDDSEFRFVDGIVAVPKNIIEDMIYRAEKGELDIDSEILNKMLIATEEREC